MQIAGSMAASTLISSIIVFFVAASCTLSLSSAEAVPAIFVFGDSSADVGNNNDMSISSGAKANFPPNGIDFPGSVPTGRFSNGYNTIDSIAKFLGYKQSPPSFLSIEKSNQMMRGVNFASGGSGILDNTGTSTNFTAQIMNFKSVVDIIVQQLGEERATILLSKSLFLLSTGSNDISGYYLTLGTQNTTQNQLFTTSLINEFGNRMESLYELGARKFGVVGISHIGCVPFIKNLNPTGKCVEDLNGLAKKFNTAAKAQMDHLKSKLEGMMYSYGNVYDLMTEALAKPSMFGFKNVISACCGSGKFNGGGPCIPNTTYCSNRNQYLFWDRVHPTQATSKLVAIKLYGGSRRFATPINLKMLVKS